MSDPKIIAFYLPQYHPTPHNDEWWGKGFTEWTNVAKARPLFRGHEQPHLPGELGFYDLRLPQVREAQAALAKEYGVYGFCYYYYRFEKGRNELDLPLKEVLNSGAPNFPFMICWANESWHKKFWRYDGTAEKQLLVEQKYNGTQDYVDFFYEILPYFKDKRYIKVNGMPAFMIYKPTEMPDLKELITIWQNLSKKEGLGGVYFIGYLLEYKQTENKKNITLLDRVKFFLTRRTNSTEQKDDVLSIGLNAVTINRQYAFFAKRNVWNNFFSVIRRKIFKLPNIAQYKSVIDAMINNEDTEENVFPIVVPNWDHTPRSKCGGDVFVGATPTLFKRHLSDILNEIKDKKSEYQILFLRAWNEWGEGNYVEPDLKWGRKYLEVIKEAIEEFNVK